MDRRIALLFLHNELRHIVLDRGLGLDERTAKPRACLA
jgi:hypothetical protein